jgi:hypothetical protein
MDVWMACRKVARNCESRGPRSVKSEIHGLKKSHGACPELAQRPLCQQLAHPAPSPAVARRTFGVVATNILLRHNNTAAASPIAAQYWPPRPHPTIMSSLNLSLEQLRAYDGSDPDKPLLIAVRGQIYDMSSGRSFYGPGAEPSPFSCAAPLLLRGAEPRLRCSQGVPTPCLRARSAPGRWR